MIHLISLCNSYPPRYIHNRFVKFFKSPLYTSTSILPLIDSHSHFAFVRSYLLDRTTTAQHQIASTIAKAIDSHDYDTEDDLLVRAQFRRKLKSMHNLVIPYIHEARFASYRKDIHQLWHHIFQQTPVAHMKLIVANRNNRSCQDLLVRRRPQQKTNSVHNANQTLAVPQ